MTAEELDAIKYAFKEAIKPIEQKIDDLREDMNARFDEVDKRLDKLERGQKTIRSDIKKLKTDSEITRTAANEAVKWLDTYHRKSDTPFPVESENSVRTLNC